MVLRLALALALAIGACSGGERTDPANSPAPAAAPSPPTAAEPPAAQPTPEPPAFSPEIRSLELTRSIAVRFAPSASAKNLGTVAAHTRVGWKRVAQGDGCSKRWIEIEPRGWVCEVYVDPSRLPPAGVELPRLGWDEIVPGQYGKVAGDAAKTYKLEQDVLVLARELAGSATVRRYGALQVGGKAYWGIGGGEYLPEASITPHTPSRWTGVELGGLAGHALPLAFVLGAKSANRVDVWTAAVGGTPVRKLERRAVVPVLETARDDADRALAYRIGDGEWLRADDARIAQLTQPPPLTEPTERWFDIDLDAQILVAYEGPTPVYATLVTTGKKKTPTETGIFRIWVKFAETDMNGQMGDEAPYSVATVPWTQFYAKDFALHTAYWHDRFGSARSHGCVNLSPADARFLYFWSSPDVPAGWSMAHGVAERPGSLVRVRSAADPDPEFKGYARHVHELRGGKTSAAAP